MRAYQEIWYDKLYNRKKVKKVCKQITEDDTGCTDPLAMVLARIVLELKEENKRLRNGDNSSSSSHS